MNPFATKPLGRTRLRLPALGFGGAALGNISDEISEAQFARCRNGRAWCEDGTSRRWFENGTLAEESRWSLGVQEGVTRRWFPSGTQQLEERWDKGLRRARREWDEKGTLLADDEFEDDGSRKLRR